VVISVKYPQYKIPLRLKNNLVVMSKEKHFSTGKIASTMLIYRTLIKALFSNEKLSSSNAVEMKHNEPILSACKGMKLINLLSNK
jgi:hypothetical protein